MFDVLFVEDNEADVLLLHEALNGWLPDIRVHVAYDGEEALLYLRREGATPPRLVLLDGNMPRKNAVEVLGEVRADPALMNLPVLVFSNSAAAADVERSLSAGADGYVTKPLGLDDFTSVVRNLLQVWMAKLEFGTPQPGPGPSANSA